MCPQPAFKQPFLRKHKSFFVGLFVLIPTILIPLFFGYFFFTSEMMEDWHFAYVKYEDTYGLKKGNDVLFRGQKIGYVSDIKLYDSYSVLVELRIRATYFKLLRKNFEAQLTQKNFVVGDWSITISPPKETTVLWGMTLRDRDTLTANMPIMVQRTLEQMSDMVVRVDEIMTHITTGQGAIGRLFLSDSIIIEAEDFMNDFSSAISHIGPITRDARRTLNTINTVFNNADSIVLNSQELTEKGAGIIDSTLFLISRLNNSLTDLNRVIMSFEETPREFNQMVNHMNDGILEMLITFRALQEHWLFKRAVPEIRKNEEERFRQYHSE